MAREDTDGAEDDAPSEPSEGTERRWASRWYRSPVGLCLLGANVLLLLVLVALSAPTPGTAAPTVGNTAASSAGLPTVPWYVYVFGGIGALGYVFTSLLVSFERTVGSVLRVTLRVPAALPLAAGVYVVAAQLAGGSVDPRYGAALAFLAGLYVNLAYRRLGALADRLLPGEDDTTGDSATEDGDDAASGDDAPSEDSADGAGEDDSEEAPPQSGGDGAAGENGADGGRDGRKPKGV